MPKKDARKFKNIVRELEKEAKREGISKEDLECVLVALKILRVEAKNRKLGKKPETEEDMLKKYPHLKE